MNFFPKTRLAYAYGCRVRTLAGEIAEIITRKEESIVLGGLYFDYPELKAICLNQELEWRYFRHAQLECARFTQFGLLQKLAYEVGSEGARDTVLVLRV